jgi:probable HAF family extracellular repeat protein
VRSSALWRIVVGLAILATLALRDAPLKGAAPPQYTITNLGTVPGMTHSYAARVNARGTVLARTIVVSTATETTFIWRDGARIPLGPINGQYPKGIAINDADQVVGHVLTSVNGQPRRRAFIWEAGVYTALGALGLDESFATDINNTGQVVGSAVALNCQSDGCSGILFKPFVWSGGTQTDLGSLGGVRAGAWAINEAGQILGASNRIPGQDGHPMHAVLWANGTMTDLESIGILGDSPALSEAGHIAATVVDPTTELHHAVVYADGTVTGLAVPREQAMATEINAAGDVIGVGFDSDFAEHAFVYRGGTVVELAPDARKTIPHAINAHGHVVGEVLPQTGARRAFVYDAGTFYDLNDLLPPGSEWERLSAATHINDAGQIVGWGVVEGVARAFRMDPIP